MAVSYLRFFILLILLYNVSCQGLFDKLCSRIYFYTSYGTDQPYVNLLNGVYKKTNRVVDKFPIFEYERGGAYFQYSSAKGIFYFSTHGEGIDHFAGVAAQGDTYLMNDPTRWIGRIDNKTHLFGRALKDWHTIDVNTQQQRYANLHPRCVNFTDCQTEELVFRINQTSKGPDGIKRVNDPFIDYFQQIPNKFVNFRQVYKHSNFAISSWYLYYGSDDYWYIGPDYNSRRGYWTVYDSAQKPEFITGKWRNAISSHKWRTYDSVNIECRGIVAKCENNICGEGYCKTTFANRSVCTCPIGRAGPTCKRKEEMCDSKTPRESMQINNGYGNVATRVCPKYSTHKTMLCKRDDSMKVKWYGEPCHRIPITPKPKPFIPPYEPIDFDKNDAYKWSLLSVAMLVPIFLPLLHWMCRRKKSLPRLLSIYWYLFALASATILILYGMHVLQPYGKHTFWILNLLAAIYLPIGYGIVFAESCCSDENEYVRESFEQHDIKPYLDSLIQTEPTVSTHVKCYHYETRSRTVYYTDSEGHSRSRLETYSETVVTWRGSHEFKYASWKDITGVSTDLRFESSKMTRLRLKTDVRFENEETRLDFFREQNAFVDANRFRDKNIEFSTQYNIEGLKERIMLYGKDYVKPWWMGRMYYWLAVILFMTWPYRILIKVTSNKMVYTFVKEISNKPETNHSAAIVDMVSYPPSYVNSAVEVEPLFAPPPYSTHDTYGAV